jgi:photosystem II stability/assembly factor-like uncharacterized protein
MNNLLLATRNGIVICDRGSGSWRTVSGGLEHKKITSVICREALVLAGSTDGLYRSEDAGRTWHEANDGLSSPHVRSLAYHPDSPNRLFAGTEPAGIFVSSDGGLTWRKCGEVEQLRDRHQWSLPYSPAAGCIRGFAFLGTRGYAAAEVGGVLRSDDSGETWRLVEGSDRSPDLEGPPEQAVDPDVHSVSVHAWSSDAVVAATGDGLYRSTDGGSQWVRTYECYCRATWLNPEDPQNMLLGPADGVDRDGRIEATNDGGLTWVPASGGLDVPWRRGMVERFWQVGEDIFAVLSDGRLLQTRIASLEWRQVAPEIQGVSAVCEIAG